LLAAAQDRIRELSAHFDGRVSIYAKNLKTGATYDFGGSNRVNTASTIKVPILIGVYSAVHDGKARWTDTSELTPASKVGGSGVLQEMSDGSKIHLRDLVRYMILLSDNTATNLVLDHVSANQVNAYLEKLGIKDTRSLRKNHERVQSGRRQRCRTRSHEREVRNRRGNSQGNGEPSRSPLQRRNRR